VQSEQIYFGTNKRPWVKTIVIQSVENDRRNNDQWDYDSSCRSTIRTTKKVYNSATRSATTVPAATAASAAPPQLVLYPDTRGTVPVPGTSVASKDF